MTRSRSLRQTALCLGTAVCLGATLFGAPGAQAAGTLTVGMPAGDVPVTTGNPDQGFEGYRFVGYNLYDSLVLWDLSGAGEKAADIKPGLATEWHVDEADNKRWIFTLRQGVKWHDGCPFTADDVVWNMAYSSDEKAPQFNAAQFAQARPYLGTYAGVEKVDDHTVAFTTKVPDALFPYMMSYVLMISPCRAKEVNNDWTQYALKPSGTGPYKFDKTVPHQRLEFVPNTEYWDKARVPKQDRLVLIPMPEASTRTAALLTGQVDWIEAPSPDAIDRLKSSGMQIVTRVYPHNWSYQLNFVKGPFTDKRVRQAANYALNREDIKDLLNGLMLEQYATLTPSTAYYGKPVLYKYDPAKAKALLKEAGCLPCKVTFAISTSGSGQMQPLPMNELVKSQLDAAGFEVTLQSMDWNALLNFLNQLISPDLGCCPLAQYRDAVGGLDRAPASRARRGRRQPRNQCDQYQPSRAGPLQRTDPPCLDRRLGAKRRQLGPSRQPRDGQADRKHPRRVRYDKAPRAAHPAA